LPPKAWPCCATWALPTTTRVNQWGGAIALGHPLGASGARLATTAVNQLHTLGGRYALCTMCIGVGQGIAVMLEKV
jgi:acetyl-CoA C-acetyltransferase